MHLIQRTTTGKQPSSIDSLAYSIDATAKQNETEIVTIYSISLWCSNNLFYLHNIPSAVKWIAYQVQCKIP